MKPLSWFTISAASPCATAAEAADAATAMSLLARAMPHAAPSGAVNSTQSVRTASRNAVAAREACSAAACARAGAFCVPVFHSVGLPPGAPPDASCLAQNMNATSMDFHT
jgi:hypothetical protein